MYVHVSNQALIMFVASVDQKWERLGAISLIIAEMQGNLNDYIVYEFKDLYYYFILQCKNRES